MAWTKITSRQYARRTARYASYMTDRKRHIIVDTLGLMVALMVHSADIQDRDGAPDLLKSIRHRWPWLLHAFADGGYAGDKLKRRLKKIGRWTVEIIKRSDKAKGFEALPRRWVVEPTFAWLGRCRRLAKDVERLAPEIMMPGMVVLIAEWRGVAVGAGWAIADSYMLSDDHYLLPGKADFPR